MTIKYIEVYKHYSSEDGVNNISFEISPGQIIGLLGANGTGKNTRLKFLAVLLKPNAGYIEINGS